MKCECKNIGKLLPHMANWYDKEKELPFVNHEPDKCKCINEIKRYTNNGITLNLCSNCKCISWVLENNGI